MSDLERELEATLRRVLDPLADRTIPARRTLQSRGAFKTVMGGAGAALTVKVLTGVAAAAAAVSVAGAVTTGSLNPAAWGQQVSEQVETCKAKLAAGQHGIGDCVSDFSSQHGAAVASAARNHGDTNPNGNSGKDNGGGSSNGKGDGKDKSSHTPPGKTSESTTPPTDEPAEAIDLVHGHPPSGSPQP
jgi:hypothetical protein